MSEKTDRIARMLLAEHHQGLPFHPLRGEDRPATLAEAYEAQDALCRLLREDGAGEIAGYKIALTSKAMQEMVGVGQPLSGAVFSTRVHTSPCTLRHGDFQHLGVECELAVRLGGALPPDSRPHDRDSVTAAVEEILPAFELVEDRRADYTQLDAESLVADNAWNAGVVLGDPLTDWQSFDFIESRGALKINGKAHSEGKAGDALGHPLEALAWLASALNERGQQLEAGMIVMTGSIVRTVFPEAGDELRFSLDGCGEVGLAFSKA
jgi:2-keto-4-pentenoate hydratase